MAKYDYQMRCILSNIFDAKEPSAKKNANNWICKMTNLVGGTQYQHAHADQAWPWELEGERTFPFVVSHGFGAHPMQFWLLPKSTTGKSEYGFLHVLPPTSMLFMRGDFVHAGGAMWHPRCHMKFYPKTEAGCVFMSQQNYWQLPKFKMDMTAESADDKIEQVFLWQHYKFPFAYPHSQRMYDVKEGCAVQVLTYPSEVTIRLVTPPKKRPTTKS